MFAPSFDYYRAGAVREALALMQQHPGAKLLAGGHSLIPLLKLRLTAPTALIDIGRIPELKGITSSGGYDPNRRADDSRRAGRVARPGLGMPDAGRGSGSHRRRPGAQLRHDRRQCRACRSRIRSADRARRARRAFRRRRSKGERTMPAADFFQGMMTTALAASEILTAIEIPAKSPGRGWPTSKFVHPASRYAVIGAAAVVTMKDGVVQRGAASRLAGWCRRRRACTEVEDAVTGSRPSAEVDGEGGRRGSQAARRRRPGRLFASAEYRKAMAPVLREARARRGVRAGVVA